VASAGTFAAAKRRLAGDGILVKDQGLSAVALVAIFSVRW
jgi:hypothetical protein